jgi:ketosteroid isomerase-like protein
MAGRRRVSRSGVVGLCLLLVSLVGCGGPPATAGAKTDVQRLLDRRAAAILDHDGSAYGRTGAREPFDHLRAVPFADWSYRLTALHRTGDTATADAELRYRLKGYDSAPVSAGRALALSRDAQGRWYVDAERPAKKSAEQLWDQGEVSVVRGEHSLVLGVGQSGAALRGYAGLADHAVPAVSQTWGTDWARHVVVLVPRSLDDMAGLLASPASSYRGIAAVTTGETGAPAKAPADRIIVNPDAYGVLGGVGKQVVLTHETTHVATRADTTAATPLWLSEGYADWVGYLGSGRAPSQAAPELWRAVREGRAPGRLPADSDFGFTGDASELSQAYESGWMACRMIADRWGEVRLGEFYRAVGAHQRRAGSVEGALKDVLGTSLEEFTARWREYLRAQLD